MNFKLRFAILFALFVAVILSVCSITIYFLYANYRENDFYERVRIEGDEFFEFTMAHPEKKDAVTLKIIQGLKNNTLYDECLAILDSKGNVIDKLPDTMFVRNDSAFLAKLRERKEYRFQDHQRQFVCTYIPEEKTYIIASGLDLVGLNKMENLRLILLLVFLGGLVVTAFVAFLFVKQAFKPLDDLSTRMQKTTELNLSERLPEKNTNDELSKITKYFNGMLQRLNDAFELQRNFVQYASHELRTPLAVMLSQTESALNKQLNAEDFYKVLNSLKEDQLNLIELTNSLLLLSQYEKLQFSVQWPTVRIDELIFESMELSKKSFSDADINFNFLEVPEIEDYLAIKGNDALLKAAFMNLIKNAYLYGNNKKVKIELKADKNEIQLCFENEGELINEQEAESVMMPFFRSNNSAKIKGYGLGLALVRRIIELHNGTIDYQPIHLHVNRFAITFNK